MNIENQYLQLLQNIYDNGIWKDNRTGICCKTIANTMLQHDFKHGFPLMTHRKLPIKSTLVELEGFIKGITSKKWFKSRGCGYWNEWSNPTKITGYKNIDEKNNLQKEEDDLGPIYGYQWRKFNEHYGELSGPEHNAYYDLEEQKSTVGGVDQLNVILRSLKDNPNDRRMICSAWNPNQISMAALPSCHVMWGVIHINGQLNLWWVQRSVDTVCGLPQNITSYATLLLLLCKFSGFTPGTLTGYLCDTHIYENHMNGVNEILSRCPCELPQLEITNETPFEFKGDRLIINWTHKDYKLSNYMCHQPIKFEVAV